MNNHLIKCWNSKVKKNDKILIAGDLSFSNKENTSKIINQLNGYKTLIMGNHDRGRSEKWFIDTGIDKVLYTPIILKERFIVSHEPLTENFGELINIHGHVHIKSLESSNYFNISAEVLNYFPINLLDILKIYQRRQY